MENDDLERVSEKDFKKIESHFKKSMGTFADSIEKMKEMMGASDVEKLKSPFDFESEEDYESYCIEFTERYRDDITEFVNKLFLLSEEARVSKEDAFELYQLLVGGFGAYLLLEKVKENYGEE